MPRKRQALYDHATAAPFFEPQHLRSISRVSWCHLLSRSTGYPQGSILPLYVPIPARTRRTMHHQPGIEAHRSFRSTTASPFESRSPYVGFCGAKMPYTRAASRSKCVEDKKHIVLLGAHIEPGFRYQPSSSICCLQLFQAFALGPQHATIKRRRTALGVLTFGHTTFQGRWNCSWCSGCAGDIYATYLWRPKETKCGRQLRKC